MPPLRNDEENMKFEKQKSVLAPNKLLPRISVLLAEIKAENNSYKLDNEIRQISYLLYQHNKITKQFYNILIKEL